MTLYNGVPIVATVQLVWSAMLYVLIENCVEFLISKIVPLPKYINLSPAHRVPVAALFNSVFVVIVVPEIVSGVILTFAPSSYAVKTTSSCM